MATETGDFQGLIREGSNKLAITGIMISTGSRYMTAEEKAKTIIDPDTELPVNPALERDKMVKSLGINRSSVAGMGEDPITSAALATIKLALAYNLHLGEISSFTYATESPEDIAKDHAINTIKAVNELAAVLNDNGYQIGYLDPQDAPHVQSACVAGVSNLAEKARTGIEGKGIIMMSDEAKYQEGSVADETGGFGSVALLVEDSKIAGNRGFLISSKTIGHHRKSVVDFSKPITRAKDEKSGVALMYKHPIVFGTFSEYAYIYGTYKSLRKAFENNLEELKDYKSFIDKYIIVPHAPYPRMYDKAIVSLIRRFAMHDKELSDRLKEETGMEETLLDGFSDQMGQLSFIIDIVNNSVKVERIIEQIKRLPKEAKGRLEDEVNSNMKFMAESIINKFDEVKGKYKLSRRLVGLMNDAQNRLEQTKISGKCIEDLKHSFDRILGYVEDFLERDKIYNDKIRKGTKIFAEFMQALKVNEVSVLSKEIGNIYTGSAGLTLASAIIGLYPEMVAGKRIIMQGYGSGFEARTLVIDPSGRDFEYLKSALEKNVAYEFSNRRSITAGEAHIVRNTLSLEGADAIMARYEDFPIVNKQKLLDMAKQFAVQTTEKVKLKPVRF